jgi:hypothetical protein
MLGKGGGLELMQTTDECNWRAVVQSMLVKMLLFSSRVASKNVLFLAVGLTQRRLHRSNW